MSVGMFGPIEPDLHGGVSDDSDEEEQDEYGELGHDAQEGAVAERQGEPHRLPELVVGVGGLLVGAEQSSVEGCREKRYMSAWRKQLVAVILFFLCFVRRENECHVKMT
ncbi:hypothetical protein CEXT_530101 [Caerostris extrusa]|uniref:Uncharacterized protein n=1 Tax=Caerostris extrusa TaxID=172846 RepID=A0AAV4TFV0_CAEEX|nr:hypothetical protein CEXT_530101 [Caerostris extrusa]